MRMGTQLHHMRRCECVHTIAQWPITILAFPFAAHLLIGQKIPDCVPHQGWRERMQVEYRIGVHQLVDNNVCFG